MKAILKNVLLTCVASGALWTSAVFAQSTTDRLEWPEVSDSYLRVGEFVDPRDVARVITGLPKREVRLLLNHPNFSEGLFAVREWDYLFNFLTGKGEEYVTCQYKVLFDKNMRVSSTHWKDEQCAKFLNDKPAKVNQTHPITLSSDGLFAFGRSDFNDLQQSGRDNLRILSGQLKSGFSTLRSVKIVGYTDRIDHFMFSISRMHITSFKSDLGSGSIEIFKLQFCSCFFNKVVHFIILFHNSNIRCSPARQFVTYTAGAAKKV